LGRLVPRGAVVLGALHGGGAAGLLGLSWKMGSWGGLESKPEANPVGYGGTAAFQWINPKSWLVSTSAAGTFLSADGGSAIAQSAFLGGLFVVGALPSCFLWLAFGAAVQRVLRNPRGLRLVNIAMGALLAPSIALIGSRASTTLCPAGAPGASASGITPPGSPARIQSISR